MGVWEKSWFHSDVESKEQYKRTNKTKTDT